MRTSIIVVEKYNNFTFGLRHFLKNNPGFKIVAETENINDTMDMILKFNPGIVIADYNFLSHERMIASLIKRIYPETIIGCVLLERNDEDIKTVIASGADFVIIKDEIENSLISVLEKHLNDSYNGNR